jgi:acid phosphatase type 7
MMRLPPHKLRRSAKIGATAVVFFAFAGCSGGDSNSEVDTADAGSKIPTTPNGGSSGSGGGSSGNSSTGGSSTSGMGAASTGGGNGTTAGNGTGSSGGDTGPGPGTGSSGDASSPSMPRSDGGPAMPPGGRPDAGPPNPNPNPNPNGSKPVTIFGVGDIADCGGSNDEKTGALMDGTEGSILLLGDNAYENGSGNDYTKCFQPSWGRHKSRMKPIPGNHEYQTFGASGYYDYFGTAAGDRAKGYYSFDAGDWHIVAINSNCFSIGGCNIGSNQQTWLKADLAANAKKCTLAFWHHPRFSSGDHGNDQGMKDLWQTLYDGNADVVLNGHDHNYERFAPQTPDGKPDPARGIREFVVGTGGRDLRSMARTVANSEVRNDSSFGVMKMALSADGYSWEFLPSAGSSFTDKGSGVCH